MSVKIKTYNTLPDIDERETLRYAGVRGESAEMSALLCKCISEAEGLFSYRVCYAECGLSTDGDLCRIGDITVSSSALAANLREARRAVIFCATVGAACDRLIARYSRTSPSRAVMISALGTERVEALCDRFCADLAAELGARLCPRFSPGYGDLPLGMQREIFALIDPPRRIGVSLGESLLMTPTKSVTAIVGIR